MLLPLAPGMGLFLLMQACIEAVVVKLLLKGLDHRPVL